jgi:hypothetical protein
MSLLDFEPVRNEHFFVFAIMRHTAKASHIMWSNIHNDCSRYT